MRQETRKGCNKWEMRAKIMSLFLTFIFFKNRKKTYESKKWLQY